MEALLREVARQGIRAVAVTNTNVSHERVWRARFAGALDFFGAIYSSWEVGARKPDPAFFEHVLRSEHLARDEALFIDDLSENVAAADSLGIDAVLFTGANSLRDAFTTRALLDPWPSL